MVGGGLTACSPQQKNAADNPVAGEETKSTLGPNRHQAKTIGIDEMTVTMEIVDGKIKSVDIESASLSSVAAIMPKRKSTCQRIWDGFRFNRSRGKGLSLAAVSGSQVAAKSSSIPSQVRLTPSEESSGCGSRKCGCCLCRCRARNEGRTGAPQLRTRSTR